MDRIEFEKEFEKLVSWFNLRSIKVEQTDLAYKKLKGYPIAALRYSADQFIETRRPTAANFPTISELVRFCGLWLDQRPEMRFRLSNFDPEEDLSYPTYKLWDGYRILRDQGEEEFRVFARVNRMPRQDIERVLQKDKYIRAQVNPTAAIQGLTERIGTTPAS